VHGGIGFDKSSSSSTATGAGFEARRCVFSETATGCVNHEGSEVPLVECRVQPNKRSWGSALLPYGGVNLWNVRHPEELLANRVNL